MKKKNRLLQTFFYDFLKIQVTNWVREILVTFENQSSMTKVTSASWITAAIHRSHLNLVIIPVMISELCPLIDNILFLCSNWVSLVEMFEIFAQCYLPQYLNFLFNVWKEIMIRFFLILCIWIWFARVVALSYLRRWLYHI